MLKSKRYNSPGLGSLMLIFFICSNLSQSLAQDSRIITGKVIESPANTALPGVSIIVKGTKKAAVTDNAGHFRIQAKSKDVLVFSFLGFENQELPVGITASINVIMNPSASSINEVVVIGYGSVRKQDLTGSVAQVNMKDISKAPVSSFAEALAGRVAGVQVNSGDGQPGGEFNIIIRGIGSLTQSTSPLYVIDGFPIESFNPNTLNPEEIESLTILKDASSTSVYGSRGANGVVVIQTKRGKIGKPVITFNSSLGTQIDLKKMKLLSPYEYIKYQQELNPTLQTTLDFFANGKTLADYKDAAGLDFQDYIIRKGVVRTHNLSVRGGNDQTRYSISGSMYNQDGIILNTGLNRYNGRITLDHTISDKLKMGITANYTGTNQFGEIINSGTTSSSVPTSYIFSRAWMYRPITATPNQDLLIQDIDLDALSSSDIRVNPLTELQNQNQADLTRILDANAYISYDINKNLNFKSTAGIRNNTLRLERFYNSKTAQGGPNPGNTNGVNGWVRNIYNNSFFTSNTLNFNKTFNDDHKITGLAFFEINGVNSATNGYGGRYLPNESLGIDGLDEGIPFNPVASSTRNTMVSYGTRLDYNYKSKYILTATFRADGSSKFNPDNRWGYFPGAAFAWNMHKEGFFRKLLPLISTSKLRLSYGSNGNNRVGDFDTYNRLTQSIDGYSFNNSTPIGSVYISSIANPDLTWEKVNTLNLGVEIGLLKDKVSLNVDLYRRNTNNLLLNALLPPTSGFGSATKNIGKLRNDGLEVTLNTINIASKNFTWNCSFNISFNKNTILELTSGQEGLPTTVSYVAQFNKPLYLAQIGKPAGMMIGYIWDGNYQYSDFNNPSPDVYILKASVPTNGAIRSTIQPGDIKYRDLNGDGVVNDYDVAFIGRGQPVHTGGFSNNFSYKGFSLNVFFQWSYGNDIYNANRLLLEGNSNAYSNINQFKSYENRWSPDNPTNDNYRTRGQGPIGFHSSRVVEDGSYVRLKTLALGYKLPAGFIKKLHMNNVSLNVAAQNLITRTNYSGLDPEVSTRNNVLTPGYDFSSYPQARTIVFSLMAEF